MPFSSAPATRPSSDAELLSVIDSEMKYTEDFHDPDRVEEIPDTFPFEITDVKGTNAVTLKRTYHGEQIEIVAHVPTLIAEDEPDHDQDDKDKSGDDKDNNNDEGEKPPEPGSIVPLTVTITKGDGPVLQFTCSMFPDEVLIDLIAYDCPDFKDLDENLQRAFHKYLEVRGISPQTTNFLYVYMIKENREYLLWLRKLKDCIKQ